MVKVASKFQASPKIVTIVKDITDSADPTCTDAQKNSLKDQESAVDKAAKRVEKAFNNAQTQLEGIYDNNTATGFHSSPMLQLPLAPPCPPPTLTMFSQEQPPRPPD